MIQSDLGQVARRATSQDSPGRCSVLPSLDPNCITEFSSAIAELRNWIESRAFTGFEPFDLLNSRLLQWRWLRTPPISYLLIQTGKRYGSSGLRRMLQVPPSRNPKALALILSAYCDLISLGEDCTAIAYEVKGILKKLRSPGEDDFCWGYDWDYISLRGTRLPAFAMNAVSTAFCAQSLVDLGETTGDQEAFSMARSAAASMVNRLNRYEQEAKLCFSYTPTDHSRILNSSALTAALLARVGKAECNPAYRELAKRAMNYLVSMQRPDGSWFYGDSRRQRWIDSFHTGYNLCALLQYREISSDNSVDSAIESGYTFYKRNFFLSDHTPKYAFNHIYPIDIHACAHAILCFATFAPLDDTALNRAHEVARWTLRHMRNPDGSFYFQKHRLWTNRTPYIRWGQAWMLHALSRLQVALCSRKNRP